MLLTVLMSEGEIGDKILMVLISIIALLPALTVHEWAHGFAAYKLGDYTAKADGRLSLNPLDHLDPVGSLMMLLVGFGWAKPVPVVTRNFKKPKRDFAIVSLAGPISNFVLAFISSIIYVVVISLSVEYGFYNETTGVIFQIFLYSAIYNIGLGLFNLIPLPPLDGSNVLMCALPPKMAMEYSKLRYYSHYIFLAIIILSRLPLGIDVLAPLDVLRDLIASAFASVGELISSFFVSDIVSEIIDAYLKNIF